MKKIIGSIVLIAFLLNGCEEVFYVKDISKSNVEIIAPTNNEVLNSGLQNFSWKTMDGADTYEIQIATPDFVNAAQLVLDSVTSKTSVSVDLISNRYQWRVKAINSAYTTNYTTGNFSVIK